MFLLSSVLLATKQGLHGTVKFCYHVALLPQIDRPQILSVTLRNRKSKKTWCSTLAFYPLLFGRGPGRGSHESKMQATCLKSETSTTLTLRCWLPNWSPPCSSGSLVFLLLLPEELVCQHTKPMQSSTFTIPQPEGGCRPVPSYR